MDWIKHKNWPPDDARATCYPTIVPADSMLIQILIKLENILLRVIIIYDYGIITYYNIIILQAFADEVQRWFPGIVPLIFLCSR